MRVPPQNGLYQPGFEKDSCGFGLIAHMDGEAGHGLVESAIQALSRLTHRGAVAADGKSGDGCGLLMKLPVEFLRVAAQEAGIELGPRFAVGMVFLNPDPTLAATARQRLEREACCQALLVDQLCATYPEVIDASLIKKLRVEAVLRRSNGTTESMEDKSPTTFFVTGN